VTRLKRVDCSGSGIRRRRRGKGFEYLDEEGRRITEPTVLERIRALALPPAWEDVWIWDCEAAGRAGIATVAVLIGGFSEAELSDAGAVAVYHSIVELPNSLDEWLTS
jgi:hypothetical protein